VPVLTIELLIWVHRALDDCQEVPVARADRLPITLQSASISYEALTDYDHPITFQRASTSYSVITDYRLFEPLTPVQSDALQF
jgi:hypothetical protein